MLSASWSVPMSLLVQVGDIATLPCNWRIQIGMARSLSVNNPHLQWQTPEETVFELKGSITFQGIGYEGRVEMPKDRLFEGDCSLSLREARFSDTGLYESFLITRHERRMRRSFIKSVQLTVTGTQGIHDIVIHLCSVYPFMMSHTNPAADWLLPGWSYCQ